MEILWAFSPFFVYVIIARTVGVTAGLISATAISAILLARDTLGRRRTAKVLEIGTLILFGGLAAYALLTKAAWSIPAVRLRVDTGLLLVVLISIAIRRPFTLQYARERVTRELWTSPEFVRTNYVITAAWAAAFAIMVAADLVMLYVPALPAWVSIVVTVLAIWGAFRLTTWYPERRRAADSSPRA